jgi:hypothetical protein
MSRLAGWKPPLKCDLGVGGWNGTLLFEGYGGNACALALNGAGSALTRSILVTLIC